MTMEKVKQIAAALQWYYKGLSAAKEGEDSAPSADELAANALKVQILDFVGQYCDAPALTELSGVPSATLKSDIELMDFYKELDVIIGNYNKLLQQFAENGYYEETRARKMSYVRPEKAGLYCGEDAALWCRYFLEQLQQQCAVLKASDDNALKQQYSTVSEALLQYRQQFYGGLEATVLSNSHLRASENEEQFLREQAQIVSLYKALLNALVEGNHITQQQVSAGGFNEPLTAPAKPTPAPSTKVEPLLTIRRPFSLVSNDVLRRDEDDLSSFFWDGDELAGELPFASAARGFSDPLSLARRAASSINSLETLKQQLTACDPEENLFAAASAAPPCRLSVIAAAAVTPGSGPIVQQVLTDHLSVSNSILKSCRATVVTPAGLSRRLSSEVTLDLEFKTKADAVVTTSTRVDVADAPTRVTTTTKGRTLKQVADEMAEAYYQTKWAAHSDKKDEGKFQEWLRAQTDTLPVRLKKQDSALSELLKQALEEKGFQNVVLMELRAPTFYRPPSPVDMHRQPPSVAASPSGHRDNFRSLSPLPPDALGNLNFTAQVVKVDTI